MFIVVPSFLLFVVVIIKSSSSSFKKALTVLRFADQRSERLNIDVWHMPCSIVVMAPFIKIVTGLWYASIIRSSHHFK